MALRKRLITLHGMIGLFGGLLLVVMGLTGSAIVFHQEIDQALNPQLMRVTVQEKRIAIDPFLESTKKMIPGSRLESIEMPQAPEETYHLSFKSTQDVTREVFVHPYTGEVLGRRRKDQTIVGFLYAVHHDLFAGKLGLYLVGFSGLIMMLQSVTGLVLWTGWRKLKSGLKLRWDAPLRLINFDLHNVGGFVFNSLLLVVGFTGTVIVGAHILLEAPTVANLPNTFQPTIAVSQLLKQADAAMPDGKTMSLSFPDEQLLVVNKKLPSDHPRFYFSSVTLNAKTGELVEVSKIVEKPAMWNFLVPIADLHFGSFGGLVTRLLYVVLGFVPMMLFGTGLVLWMNRKKRPEPTRSLETISR
jgi:uncharacterized iron-regulated membrane protein